MKGRGRGFASMDPEKRQALARKGGRRAHELGKAHTYDTAEAMAAGRKGGLVTGGRRHDEAIARGQSAPVARECGCKVPGPGNGESRCKAPMRWVCQCWCHKNAEKESA